MNLAQKFITRQRTPGGIRVIFNPAMTGAVTPIRTEPNAPLAPDQNAVGSD